MTIEQGWSVEERQEDDGSWSIVSIVLSGLVVAGDTREQAWAQWPEVVELWASTANDGRVKAERVLRRIRETAPRLRCINTPTTTAAEEAMGLTLARSGGATTARRLCRSPKKKRPHGWIVTSRGTLMAR